MQIKKKYRCEKGRKCTVNISVESKKNTLQKIFKQFIGECNEIYDNIEYINIMDLNNKELLEKNKIEYVTKITNKFVEEINYIPIGLIDFTSISNNSSELKLYINNSDLYKAEQILENIEEAITIKHESVKMKNRCYGMSNKIIQLD
ncbi:hypothetical protein [Clostridium felsineum]|uniref:Uncharacterized protein n=1 Tax=Clostridium felsineum TaxID=36839 RepID=A0A1S8MDT4_9CLOT|nr:hypothetical protein [Clostridium felsineum]URZ06470.1 hypothetical protein CLROS_018030 [Clostridium felsineum]URZ11505.1 hypothetical protein CROST_022220 [Clostridium felsineum]